MARTLRRSAALSLLAFALAPASGAGASREPLPRLVGDATRSECVDALALARVAFFGPTFALDMPAVTPPAKLLSRFVLADTTFDDDTSPSTNPDFEHLTAHADPADITLWEHGDAMPWRWVATRNTYSWRGDTFGLYAVGVTTSQEAFLAHRRHVANGEPEDDAHVTTVFEGLLRPPCVLRARGDATLWALDGGQPWVALSRWTVFVRGERGPLSPCSISFGLEEAQRAVSLLPPDLARLDALLLDALGPGTGEGTLHPTARIQIDVQRTWANIALRPWSLPQPYNTRDEIEAGLVEWGSQDVDQGAELARIHALLPRAERSLADYYRRVFGISPEQARRSAAHAIDVALRMHFVFHSERGLASAGAPPESNPWPADAVRPRASNAAPRR